MDRLSIDMSSSSAFDVALQSASTLGVEFSGPVGTRDYEKLLNKPSINGTVLLGDQTSADLNIVSENTEDGWSKTPEYVPKKGEICFYTDTVRMKIGDGSVCLVDLPYVGSEDVGKIARALEDHINDTTVHVTAHERAFWNAKLNYDINGEELSFTRN